MIITNVEWTASASCEWVEIKPSSGTGSIDNVRITPKGLPNSVNDDEECTIRFTSKNGEHEEFKEFKVKRCPYVCSCDDYEISGATEYSTIPSTGIGETVLASISANKGCKLDEVSFKLKSNKVISNRTVEEDGKKLFYVGPIPKNNDFASDTFSISYLVNGTECDNINNELIYTIEGKKCNCEDFSKMDDEKITFDCTGGTVERRCPYSSVCRDGSRIYLTLRGNNEDDWLSYSLDEDGMIRITASEILTLNEVQFDIGAENLDFNGDCDGEKKIQITAQNEKTDTVGRYSEITLTGKIEGDDNDCENILVIYRITQAPCDYVEPEPCDCDNIRFTVTPLKRPFDIEGGEHIEILSYELDECAEIVSISTDSWLYPNITNITRSDNIIYADLPDLRDCDGVSSSEIATHKIVIMIKPKGGTSLCLESKGQVSIEQRRNNEPCPKECNIKIKAKINGDISCEGGDVEFEVVDCNESPGDC